MRGLSAGRSVRFRSHDTGRDRALDTTDGVGAKAPAREQRAPADWRRGGELMPLEEEMVANAAAGELVDGGGGPFSLVEMQAWGAERTVRAAVLRHLLIGKDWPTDARGVRLHGIRVSGPLDLQAATLHCPLHLDSCFLDDKLVCLDQAAATVLLADITGMLSCQDARLAGRDDEGRSIAAYGMRVTGDVWLDKKFMASGEVSLRSSRIGGTLWLQGKLTADENEPALDAAGAQIAGTFRWAPAEQVTGRVSLDGAAVGELDDDWTSVNGFWPTGGRLSVKGFTYDRVGGTHPATVGQRLEWLRSQYPSAFPGVQAVFATQPYEQFAAVCRRVGQDTAARKVAIARRSDLRKYGNLNRYRKFGNWLLDKTIKYGYQTWRAGVGLAALFGIVLALSVLGQHQHVMVPVGDIKGLRPVPSATQCTSNYPCFYPAGYTVDTVIPLINVHQAEHWGPDGHAAWGWLWVGSAWVATGLGWALATLLVAGYTGLVRQE